MSEIKKRINEALMELNLNSEKALARRTQVNPTTLKGVLYDGKGMAGTHKKIQKAIIPINLQWIISGEDPKYLTGIPQKIRTESVDRSATEIDDQEARQKRLIEEAVGATLATDPRLRLMDEHLEEIVRYLRSQGDVIGELKDKLSQLNSLLEQVIKSQQKGEKK